MEGLIFFLAEFLKILTFVAVLVLIVLFLVPELLALVIAVVFRFVVRHRKSPLAGKILRFARILALGCLGLFVVLLLLLAIANSFYYEATLRRILQRIERKTDIEVRFENAEGSLFEGRADMSGVTIVRSGHPLSNFDMQADSLFVDLSMKHLLSKQAVFEKVMLKDVRGNFDRVAVAQERSRRPATSGPGRVDEPVLPRRRFRIDEFVIEDANVSFRDRAHAGKEIDAAVEIDHMRTEPLLSNQPVYCVLFETQLDGRLNGEPFGIERNEAENRNQSRWHARAVPIELLNNYVGGPLRWLQKATVDVEVENQWERAHPDAKADIEMQWSFVFRDIEAQVPADAGRIERFFAEPVVAYFQEHTEHLPIRFGFTVNRGQFEGQASLETVGLLRSVEQALIKKIAETIGIKEEDLREAAKSAVNKLKGLWQQFKQKK